MKKIFNVLALPVLLNLLFISITTAQKVMPERCSSPDYDSAGYCMDGIIVIPCVYQHGSEFSGEAAAVRNWQRKSALIDAQGKEITPFVYDELTPSNNFPGRFVCKLGNNVGVIDDKGKELIPLKYQTVEFNYVFHIDGDAYYDSSACFVLSQNGKYGVLSALGVTLCDFKYDQIWIYTQWDANAHIPKIFVVAKNGTVRLMKPGGKLEKGIEYDAFLGFWGDDFVFRKGKKIEFFHYPTQTKIKIHQDENTGKYFVADESGKKGLVDSIGNVCIPFNYHEIKYYYSTIFFETAPLFILRENSWGIITAGGKEIVPVKYDEVGIICMDNEQVFKVSKNGKWAMFDNTGKQLSEFKYDELSCWTKNSARIEIGERKGELFFDGREVWE